MLIMAGKPKKIITYRQAIARLRQMQGDKPLFEFARSLGLSAPYLSQIMYGKRGFNQGLSPTICKHLKLARRVRITYTEEENEQQ